MDEVWSVPGYDVETLLGWSATGEVWRAREVLTGDVVALRRLPSGISPAALEALSCQVTLTRRLDTPYVVRLRAVVGDVLVLDHAPGGSLALLLSRRGALDPGEVVTVAAPLASALAEIHALGSVHGDVTPASVRFTVEGMPLLDGLGLARALREDRPGDDSPPGRHGPGVFGSHLDAAADVRALAGLGHRMLYGSPPEDGTSVDLPGVAGAGQRAPLGSSAPRALVEALQAGLAADPADRPDAAAWCALLRRAHATAPVRMTGGARAGSAVAGSAVAGSASAGSASAGSGAGDPLARAGLADSAVVPRPAQARAGRSWGDRGQWGLSREHGLPGRVRGGHAASSGPHRRLPPYSKPVSALVAAVVLAAGVGWVSGRGDAAGASVVVPLAAPVAPPVARPVASPAGPARGLTAPPRAEAEGAEAGPFDWAGLLDQLDTARADSFARADPAALRQVWSPGSAGLTADAAAIRQLAAAGQRAVGLRHALREVKVVRVSASAAQLRVVDVLSAHEVLRGDGTAVRRVAERGSATWTVRLVRGDAGWRLGSVEAT